MKRLPKFQYPITYHVIEDYRLLEESSPECTGFLEACLQDARDEITQARETVPFIREHYTDEEDKEMLDALIALAGESAIYKVHIEQDGGKVIQCVTCDNLAFFKAVLVVNILGIVSHWADESIPGGIKVFFHPRWEGHEEYYGPVIWLLKEFVEKRKVLDGIETVDFYIDKEG